MSCIEGNREENFSKARMLIKDLDKFKGLQFIVLPELFAIGFRYEDYEVESRLPTNTLDFMKEIAVDKQSYVVATDIEPHEGMFYNTMMMVNPEGQLLGEYRKIHPFHSEKDVFKGGDQVVLFELNQLRVGVQICYDLRFPEVSRQLAAQGAELIIIPAAWPDPRGHHWDTLLLARAIENQVYVAACNRVRTGFDGKTFFGHSQLVDPWGVRLTRVNSEERIVVEKGDTAMLDSVRATVTCWQDIPEDGYDKVVTFRENSTTVK
jgi:predicted amidohydrolase